VELTDQVPLLMGQFEVLPVVAPQHPHELLDVAVQRDRILPVGGFLVCPSHVVELADLVLGETHHRLGGGCVDGEVTSERIWELPIANLITGANLLIWEVQIEEKAGR